MKLGAPFWIVPSSAAIATTAMFSAAKISTDAVRGARSDSCLDSSAGRSHVKEGDGLDEIRAVEAQRGSMILRHETESPRSRSNAMPMS
jgi:hypothetical protein